MAYYYVIASATGRSKNGRKAKIMSKTQTAEIRSIRQALRAEFGARQYRITLGGEIHVNGTMPNTNQAGWYLYGTIDSAETLARLGLDA